MLHVHPLLGNVLVNKFPRKEILGNQSVAKLCNNKGSYVFRVHDDVTTVDGGHVICVYYRFKSVPRLHKQSSYKLRIIAAQAHEQANKEMDVGSS
jgi:hypothetical protein